MRVLGLIVAVACLAGCAAARKEREQEVDLDRIVRWLPGTYDNTLQAKDDVQKGVHPPHDAVELAIVALGSVSIGRNAFYMQEMAADDPRRVMSQRVVIFNATNKGIVESVATLVDPLRWRDGQRDPDVFMGMTPKDLTPVSGCELIWKRAAETAKAASAPAAARGAKAEKEALENGRLVGANDPKRCKATSHASMGLVEVELRAELSAEEFSMAELQYDSSGRLLQGNKDEPFYRYRKNGH